MGRVRSGLISVTFRNKPVDEVLALAVRGAIEGLEWSGDCHVPPGEIGLAREVMMKTLRARLTIASYGSFFLLGKGDREGASFDPVLDTASELQAPIVRVWAGDKPSRKTPGDEFAAMVEEARNIARKAAVRGVTIVFELHPKTYTDSPAAAVRFMKAVDDPFVRLIWAPRQGHRTEPMNHGIEELSPWIVGLRCFNRGERGERFPLAERGEDWLPNLGHFSGLIASMPLDRYAFISFVKGDSEESLLEDAGALNGWLATLRKK
jgi:3-dehydroshikimate dehydratase